MENSVERLRNKLTPFLNLARMLDDLEEDISLLEYKNIRNHIFREIKICNENRDDIDRILYDIGNGDRNGFVDNKHLIDQLPKTTKLGLHNTDPTVNTFIQLLKRTNNNEYIKIIDEMFVHYNDVLKNQTELIDLLRNR